MCGIDQNEVKNFLSNCNDKIRKKIDNSDKDNINLYLRFQMFYPKITEIYSLNGYLLRICKHLILRPKTKVTAEILRTNLSMPIENCRYAIKTLYEKGLLYREKTNSNSYEYWYDKDILIKHS